MNVDVRWGHVYPWGEAKPTKYFYSTDKFDLKQNRSNEIALLNFWATIYVHVSYFYTYCTWLLMNVDDFVLVGQRWYTLT